MERLAVSFIQRKGFTILQRNFRSPYGEIDIIAETGDHNIIFIEVKARKNLLENAFSSVSQSKQRRILKTAAFYLQSNPELENRLVRFDVIGIAEKKDGLYQIEHMEDAFRGDSCGFSPDSY